jgi:hypothetical protein
VVAPPSFNHDLGLLQCVEDFAVEQLIAQFCSDIPASRQATGVAFPCAIETSIWRSSVTICSALNRFFGMTQAPFQAHFLTSLGPRKPGQVKFERAWLLKRKAMIETTARRIVTMTADAAVGSWKSSASLRRPVEF